MVGVFYQSSAAESSIELTGNRLQAVLITQAVNADAFRASPGAQRGVFRSSHQAELITAPTGANKSQPITCGRLN